MEFFLEGFHFEGFFIDFFPKCQIKKPAWMSCNGEREYEHTLLKMLTTASHGGLPPVRLCQCPKSTKKLPVQRRSFNFFDMRATQNFNFHTPTLILAQNMIVYVYQVCCP